LRVGDHVAHPLISDESRADPARVHPLPDIAVAR
jgi:hypothetical protein